MPPRIGRLVHKADFECLLAAPVAFRSAHFAIHHDRAGPAGSRQADAELGKDKLSTDGEPHGPTIVDNSAAAHWIAVVLPKRHARRAVTRNLVRRMVRSAFAERAASLHGGRWLVRMRQPFAAKQFPSASSPALRSALRDELAALFRSASTQQVPK